MFQKKDYFVLIATILAIITLISLTIIKAKSLLNITNEIKGEKIIVEKLYDKIAYLEQVKVSEGDYLDVINRYRQMLPGKPYKNDVIETMYDLANKNSINLGKVEFKKEVKGKKILKLPLTIGLHGDYIGTMGYLKDIRGLSRVYNITNINLVKKQESNNDIYGEINLDTYYEQ